MSIENQIITIIRASIEASPKDLSESISISRRQLHTVLKRLTEDNILEKIGRSPRVYYRIKEQVKSSKENTTLAKEEASFLDMHFNLLTETGNKLNGAEGFEKWCQKQKLPFQKTVLEYIKTRQKYLDYFGRNELINGTEKLINTKAFDRVCIDEMYYGDFYAIERFGKTKLGNLLHFAKQGQNKMLMDEISALLHAKIQNLINEKNIDAVGYIPPTIKREVQIMSRLKTVLNFSVPHINLKKVSGMIPIPQKALSKIEDRISNARSSIVADEKRVFNKILLIDDAVGSGATINETACKIKMKKLATEVIGFAVVGSFKGFDVIQEV